MHSFRSEESRIKGDYRVIVRHGRFNIEDSLKESVSICDKQTFTRAAGEFAAILLDVPKLCQCLQGQKNGLKPMAPHRQRELSIVEIRMLGFLISLKRPRLFTPAESPDISAA